MKDIIEILKYAPRGLKLYTTTLGTVEFMKVNQRGEIVTFGNDGTTIESFDRFGRKHPNGECLLFPDCDHRDWDFIWQGVLFRKGDFITTKQGTGVITDLENRRCVSPVGDTINFIIDRDTTRWASPVEISNFMESLEIHGWVWDEVSLSVKPTRKMSKEITETHEFEKSLTEDLEFYHKLKEHGVGEDKLKEWIYCWSNTLLGIAKNLYVKEDDSETQTQELGEIKSREEGHGITSTDMMSITGGVTCHPRTFPRTKRMKPAEIRYDHFRGELELTDEYGNPEYLKLDELEPVDANERLFGTETEYRTKDGIHVVIYPEGHLDCWWTESENEPNPDEL